MGFIPLVSSPPTSNFTSIFCFHYTALQKKKLEYTIDECDHFLCFFGHWIRIWHQFCPITSRFCCMRGDNFWKTIENEKNIFQKQCLVDIFFLSFLMYFRARNTIKSFVFAKNVYFFSFWYFLFWTKKFCSKVKTQRVGIIGYF